jgi:hypothetical protein
MKHTVWVVVPLALSLGAFSAAQDKPGEPDAVARTREQIGRLKKALEELRGEKLKTEVAVKYASEDSLDKESKVDIDHRYDTRADQISRAYERIGLFPKAYDLHHFMSAFASAVLAFYEPSKKTFFVVRTDLGDEATDATAIHELAHALQDQRFDLRAYYHVSDDPDPIATNDDAQLARRIVVEGEACYIGTIYEAKQENYSDKVDSWIETRAALTREQLSKLERKQAALVEGGKGTLKALNAADALPAYLYQTMFLPYLRGPATISEVKKKGGWKAVDDLFQKPPAAAKQVLHLDKLRSELDAVEVPDLSFALGSGFKRTFENTFGEVGVRCILEARALTKKLPEVAARIAATWTGDRFQAYETKERETCALWVTAWETEDAAKEFEVAGKEILKGETSSTRDSFVERRGKRVLLVLGAPRKRTKEIVEGALGAKK